MSDHTQTLNRSARKFFSGTFISRCTGFIRDLTTAAAFGISPPVAAFMLAFRLSHCARRIFGEGAFQSAFIPQFEEIRQKHSLKGMQFFCNLAVNVSALLGALILFFIAGLALLLRLDFFTDESRQVAILTALMLPSLLFICLYGINTALLQCEKHYFISSLAPAFFNIVWILCVALVWNWDPSRAMLALALSINFACFAQWLATALQTYQILKPHLSKLQLKINLKTVKKFYAPFALSVTGVVATQINSAIDPLFARVADLEGPALLWYAIRLQQLPLALFGIAISSASLPLFSRTLEKNDDHSFTRLLFHSIKKNLYWALPATLALMFFGTEMVRLIYERGDFGQAAVIKTTACLKGYALGLCPSALVLVLAPALYAQKNYRTPMIGSLVSMGANLGLNSLFIMGFGWGPASVAYSTSLCAYLNLAILSSALFALYKSQFILNKQIKSYF